jgi:hypothetical protein
MVASRGSFWARDVGPITKEKLFHVGIVYFIIGIFLTQFLRVEQD